MARTKSFDPDRAVDAAMTLFWDRGYAATSTTDLVERLGVARSSLYGTFGDKRSLYLAALRRYVDGRGGPAPEDLLAGAASPLAGVDALLRSFITVDAQRDPQGCFAVNASLEFASDPDVAAILDANRARLRGAVRTTLLRARAEGETHDHLDVDSAVEMIVVVANGLQVLSRTVRDDRTLAASVDATVAGLRA